MPSSIRTASTPEHTTAAAFFRYATGEVVADSSQLQWRGLYVRRLRLPRIVDTFLVPATAEPHISCVVHGSADFQERDIGNQWISRRLRRGDIFVTRSRIPYELRFKSPAGEELDFISIHLAVDEYLSALRGAYPGEADAVEVIDFFGRDEALAHVCFTAAEMLASKVPADSKRVPALRQMFSTFLVERYIDKAVEKPSFRGGLPIGQLRRVEDYIRQRLAEDISVQALADLVELSPFHFSRMFKKTAGMSPLQFVTRERLARAQQLIRETPRSLIEIGLEVGYSNPSHFAQVFRRVVGVTPTEFRSKL